MKVLVVDDELLIRRSLRKAAEMKGHEVFEAVDGIDGLKKWRETQPDLVFLDVLMPGLTGPDVLREMKGKSAAKVVLISAYAGEFDPKTLAGANLFIPKPFDDIFAVIEQGEGLFNG